MDEGQRARLRRLVIELTDGGPDMAGLPRHKTGLVERLRELGRDDEAMRIEYGAGFSLYAGEGGVVRIILRLRSGAAAAASSCLTRKTHRWGRKRPLPVA